MSTTTANIPARIQETADAILDEVIAQTEQLEAKPTHELTELLHSANELHHHPQSQVRVAASIVGAAAQLALEKRNAR